MRRTGLTLLELLVVLAVLVALAALAVPLMSNRVTSTELDVTYQTMLAVRDAIMGTPTVPGYRPDMKGVSPPRTGTDPTTGVAYAIADAAGLPANLYLGELLANPSITGRMAFDPQTRFGWRGPYLTQSNNNAPLATFLGTTTQTFVLDSYPVTNPATHQVISPGRPIIIEWPPATFSPQENFVRLRSFGADGVGSAALATKWDPRPTAANPVTSVDCGDDVVLYLRRDLPGMDWTNYWDLKRQLGN
jgi:prepilin-type N-terminal cleavage/methylation domain-containing protein